MQPSIARDTMNKTLKIEIGKRRSAQIQKAQVQFPFVIALAAIFVLLISMFLMQQSYLQKQPYQTAFVFQKKALDYSVTKILENSNFSFESLNGSERFSISANTSSFSASSLLLQNLSKAQEGQKLLHAKINFLINQTKGNEMLLSSFEDNSSIRFSPPTSTINVSSLSELSLFLNTSNETEFYFSPPLESNGEVPVHIILDSFDSVDFSCGSVCSINRDEEYYSNFSSPFGMANISFIDGVLFVNSSSFFIVNFTSKPQKFYFLWNETQHEVNGAFSDICAQGTAPSHASKFSSFEIEGATINVALGQDYASFDANNNCLFDDFDDEYKTREGDYVYLNNTLAVIKLLNSTHIVLHYVSGSYGKIGKTKFAQPIFFNKD